MISLIALEALLILFAAPLPVSVRLHVSDERSYAAASVSLFGARLVTARAEIAKDRVRMRINGKNAETGEVGQFFAVRGRGGLCGRRNAVGCVCGGAFDASEGGEKESALGQGVGEVRAGRGGRNKGVALSGGGVDLRAAPQALNGKSSYGFT